MSRLTVKPPFEFWISLTANPFSGEQVAGTSSDFTEDSHLITRKTNATLVNSYVISWNIEHPFTSDDYSASFVSSDSNVANVDTDGVLEVVSDGIVTITVTVTRASDGYSISNSIPVDVSITAGSSIDYVSPANGTVISAFEDSLRVLLSGVDPSTAKPRFSSAVSSQELQDVAFTRNEDFWCKDLEGLSAISPNNSRSGNRRSGTALTKRHIVTTAHYPLYVGDTVDFVSDVNGTITAVTKTIKQVKNHPLYRGNSGGYSYDVQICLLDSDLPDSIDTMELLPSNALDYVGQYEFISTPCVTFDQEQKALTRVCLRIGEGIYYATSIDNHWFATTGALQMVNGYNYETSLLGISSTSEYFSNQLLSPTDLVVLLNEHVIVGDSGCPSCFVLNNKLILIGLSTYPQGGAYLPNLIPDINQLIVDVDTLEGISTGYTVTECDISAYPTY